MKFQYTYGRAAHGGVTKPFASGSAAAIPMFASAPSASSVIVIRFFILSGIVVLSLRERSFFVAASRGARRLLLNTTNQLCIGSKRSGTLILPSFSKKSGSSRIAPVSGSQSSGRFPLTRKVQGTSSGRFS